MSEKEAKEKLLAISRQHLPNVATNLFVALLIWLFGVLVFIPAANQILPQRIPLAASLIVLIGFTIFIARAISKGLPSLLDSTSNVIAFDYKKWKKTQMHIEKLKRIMKAVIHSVSILILYLLYSPFLLTIHPSLNGLLLIPLILWIMWTALKIINTTLLEK